jgi:hypothetical protein
MALEISFSLDCVINLLYNYENLLLLNYNLRQEYEWRRNE